MASKTKTFDIKAWLKQATPQTIEVVVSGAGAAASEKVALMGEYETLKVTNRVVSSPRQREIVDRIAELTEEIRAAEVTLRLRAVDGESLDRIRDEYPAPPEPEMLSEDPSEEDVAVFRELEREHRAALTTQRYALVSAACVEPAMTVEDVRALRGVIGEAKWAEVVGAVNTLTWEDFSAIPFLPTPLDETTPERS